MDGHLGDKRMPEIVIVVSKSEVSVSDGVNITSLPRSGGASVDAAAGLANHHRTHPVPPGSTITTTVRPDA